MTWQSTSRSVLIFLWDAIACSWRSELLQRWFGQKPFMRFARIAGTWSHPVGGRTLPTLNGSAALVDNRVNDLQDGRAYSGQITIETALSPTPGIIAGFALDRQSFRDPGYSTTGARVSLNGWHDIGRMTLTTGVDLGRLLADERLSLFPSRRSDRYTRRAWARHSGSCSSKGSRQSRGSRSSATAAPCNSMTTGAPAPKSEVVRAF